MLDIIIVVAIAVCSALIIYIILDARTEEEEILKERLVKISQMKDSDEKVKQKVNLLEKIISNYIKPRIQSYTMNQKDESKEKERKDTRQLLMEAGKPFSDDDILRFKATQVFFGLVTLVFGLIFGVLLCRNNMMLFLSSVVLIPFIGYKFPVFALRMEIKKRCQEIAYNLPDALDLLVVCVEAGLGLDAALTKVSSEQMRTAPVMAKEFGRVSKDILAGVSRQESFRNLGLRNPVPDLRSFVALLIQTDKLGTSIAQSLRVYADTVRTKRRQKAEKLAAEASVKMVIPLVLFILPSMFVVLLGPAVINLIQQFSGM